MANSREVRGDFVVIQGNESEVWPAKSQTHKQVKLYSSNRISIAGNRQAEGMVMTQTERRDQLRDKITINLEKWKTAQKHNDRGSMTLFTEIISDCRRELVLLPKIYALKNGGRK